MVIRKNYAIIVKLLINTFATLNMIIGDDEWELKTENHEVLNYVTEEIGQSLPRTV